MTIAPGRLLYNLRTVSNQEGQYVDEEGNITRERTKRASLEKVDELVWQTIKNLPETNEDFVLATQLAFEAQRLKKKAKRLYTEEHPWAGPDPHAVQHGRLPAAHDHHLCQAQL